MLFIVVVQVAVVEAVEALLVSIVEGVEIVVVVAVAVVAVVQLGRGEGQACSFEAVNQVKKTGWEPFREQGGAYEQQEHDVVREWLHTRFMPGMNISTRGWSLCGFFLGTRRMKKYATVVIRLFPGKYNENGCGL